MHRKMMLVLVLAALVIAAGSGFYYLRTQQSEPLSPDVQQINLPKGHPEFPAEVLLAYLGALRTGRYAEAARIYGGSYEILIEYNPQLDPQNHAALLEAACTVNGFLCHLEPKNVLQAGSSEFGIHLTVEFQNPDGSTFELLCAKPGSPGCVNKTQFDYTVRERDGYYRVLELPVYVQ